ncbi:hypothetical protein VC77_07690 [Vibrio cholerae]|nr:hypothetical protein VC77_07690 [Vibrio cholerae]
MVKLLQSQPKLLAMDGPTKLKFTLPLVERSARIQFVADMLKNFQQMYYLLGKILKLIGQVSGKSVRL